MIRVLIYGVKKYWLAGGCMELAHLEQGAEARAIRK